MYTQFDDMRIAITGCCGTVGGELIHQLRTETTSSVVGLDQDEAGLFFQRNSYRHDEKVEFHLADIRDVNSIAHQIEGADLVIHTAALKHVPLCEDAPSEAVRTNIMGTQHVLEAVRRAGIPRLLFTSTDKAVNPTNVMGTTKLMAERLVTAAAATADIHASTTRFGNVLGSSGSVIPVFHRQIAQGGPLTVTDPEMTRFVMSLEDATRLVLESIFISDPGDVVITKMPVAKVGDLAHVMIEALAPQFGFSTSDIGVSIIGPRPGEKQYEELMNQEELRRSFDLGDFLVIRPAMGSSSNSHASLEQPTQPYNSHHQSPMTRSELSTFLNSHNLLSP